MQDRQLDIEHCAGCSQPITSNAPREIIDGKHYHEDCLPVTGNHSICLGCGKPVNHQTGVEINGDTFHFKCIPEGDPDYNINVGTPGHIDHGHNHDEVMSHNVGDSNYAKKKIQPWDVWEEYTLNPWDADIVKRTLRIKESQSRRMDYEKIIHICQKRISQIDRGIKVYGSDVPSNPVICESCQFVRSGKFRYCPECGSENIDS